MRQLSKVDELADLTTVELVERKIHRMIFSGNLVSLKTPPSDRSGWQSDKVNSSSFTVRTHPYYFNNTRNLYALQTSSSNELELGMDRLNLLPNTTYQLSFIAFAGLNVNSIDVLYLGRKTGETQDFTRVVNVIDKKKLDHRGIEFVTATFNTGDTNNGYLRFDNNGSTDGQNAIFFFGEILLTEL